MHTTFEDVRYGASRVVGRYGDGHRVEHERQDARTLVDAPVDLGGGGDHVADVKGEGEAGAAEEEAERGGAVDGRGGGGVDVPGEGAVGERGIGGTVRRRGIDGGEVEDEK